MAINIMDNSTQLLEASLSLRLARQNLIASNLANAETPGYRGLDMNFEKVLKDISDLQETSSYDPASGLEGQGIQIEIIASDTLSMGNENNTVSVEKELGKMTKNALMFKAQVIFLGKKMALIRAAISGNA